MGGHYLTLCQLSLCKCRNVLWKIRFKLAMFTAASCIVCFVINYVQTTNETFEDQFESYEDYDLRIFSERQEELSDSQEIWTNGTKNNTFVAPPTLVRGTNINDKILKYVRIQKTERLDPHVNMHSYEYSLNSDTCKKGDLSLVMMIHSAPGYVKKRNLIRATFGSVCIYRGKRITKVFLIGTVNDSFLQKQLEEESRLYGDIVQGNFKDQYRNLAKKHIMGMHWYQQHCKSQYILKIDDDTFVNPYQLVDFILKVEPQGKKMYCYVAEGYRPFKKPESLLFTSRREYPFFKFPQFCLGFAYLTTPETWHALYEASKVTRIMHMDDVLVGILALQSNVEKVDWKESFLPCKDSKIDLGKLNEKMIVIDLISECGDLPFTRWDDVKYGHVGEKG